MGLEVDENEEGNAGNSRFRVHEGTHTGEEHTSKICQPRSVEAVVRLKSSFHWKPSTCMAFLSLLSARNLFLLSPARLVWSSFSVALRTGPLVLSLSTRLCHSVQSGGETESKDTVDSQEKLFGRFGNGAFDVHRALVCGLRKLASFFTV